MQPHSPSMIYSPWESSLIASFNANYGSNTYPTPPESIDGLEGTEYPSFSGYSSSPGASYDQNIVGQGNFLGLEADDEPESDVETVTGETVMTVSTSFHPGSHPQESDLIVSSSDEVLFYVHSEIIRAACPAALPAILSFAPPGVKDPIIFLTEPAPILNIIFHILYQTSCAHNSPSTNDLITAVDKLPIYNITPSACIRPTTAIYTLLLSHAPLRPLDIYALASHHGIEELAVQSSSHLLAYPLDSIDDATAARIGPAYLKRLFLLHMCRTKVLKDILLKTPSFHAPTKTCDFEDQKRLSRAWALGSTCIAWDVRPDLSNHKIQSTFEPLCEKLPCDGCKSALRTRIREVQVDWASVKCTI